MLEARELSKNFNHRFEPVVALHEVNLCVAPGDFVAIVGPSGSGKSTLLLALGGMLTPSSGEVVVEGQSLYKISSEKRARFRGQKIGFLFQTFNLIPYLTTLENVQVPLYLKGVDTATQIRGATALLERVGLEDRLHHKPSELSVGQQQRVALARAIANDPRVVLADEPTGNLDPETRQSVMSFLTELNREGRTVIMVTHDPLVADVARTRLRLVAGRIAD